MKYVWKDLPKPMNCFTVRSARMINLNTGKIVSNYSANTKIVVVQKCVTPNKTYYRTQEAAYHYLNYAFEAAAFGLPNEKAPSAPSSKSKKTPNSILKYRPTTRTPKSEKKQTSSQKTSSKGGEKGKKTHWIKKLFRRKNG